MWHNWAFFYCPPHLFTNRGRVDTQVYTGYKQAQGPHTTLGLIYTRLAPPAATAAVAFTIAATVSGPRIFAVTGVGVTAVGRSRVLQDLEAIVEEPVSRPSRSETKPTLHVHP